MSDASGGVDCIAVELVVYGSLDSHSEISILYLFTFYIKPSTAVFFIVIFMNTNLHKQCFLILL